MSSALDVKVGKQGQQRDHIEKEHLGQSNRVGGSKDDIVDSLEEVDQELGHLHESNVLLVSNFDVQTGQQIIEIHPNVNKRVLSSREEGWNNTYIREKRRLREKKRVNMNMI